MSEQENIQITRRFYEMMNSHKMDTVDQYVTDDFRAEETGVAGTLDKTQDVTYTQRFIDALPDVRFDLKDVFAQGDNVAATWIAKGTQKGPLVLPTGDSIPATNRNVTIPGCTILKFRGNKVSYQHNYWDQVAFLMQLGLISEQDLMARVKH